MTDTVTKTTAYSLFLPPIQLKVTKTTAYVLFLPPSAPTIGERVSAADVLVTFKGITPAERVSAADALVALNYPSPFERVTLALGLVTVKNTITLRVTNAAVLVAVRGRIANPKLRAWTFTLDGHDFYVLRLGLKMTLVYDVTSEQWVDWDAYEQAYWPTFIGINWVGGTGILDADGSSFHSNVLVGDDTLGLLYFLDPEQPWDQSFDGPLDPDQEKFFPRVLQGQVPMLGRENMPCYAVWLNTDMGDPAYVGAGVKLEISDDAGKTYDDMGTITVTTGVNSPELFWGSLGQIEAPGRLFRITDDGAVARIDGMEMNDPDDK
jgi:hypothetical protein